MSAQAHAAAVKALIGTTVRLYEAAVPDDATLPYAVLWIGSGTSLRSTLCAVSDRRDTEFQITSVALDPTGVRSVADRVRAAVLDRRPAITGRSSDPVRQVSDQPLRVDRDVTPHRLYVVDVYSFSTVPAPA